MAAPLAKDIRPADDPTAGPSPHRPGTVATDEMCTMPGIGRRLRALSSSPGIAIAMDTSSSDSNSPSAEASRTLQDRVTLPRRRFSPKSVTSRVSGCFPERGDHLVMGTRNQSIGSSSRSARVMDSPKHTADRRDTMAA